MKVKCVILCLLILHSNIPEVRGSLGVDVSQPTSSFSCMRSNGIVFAIVRGYLSYGAVDTAAVQTLRNAKSAGLIADAYFFPCPGKSATTQANEFINYFNQYGAEEPTFLEANQEQVQQDEVLGMRAGLYEKAVSNENERITQEEEEIKPWYQVEEQQLGSLYGTVWIDVETNPSSGCHWSGQTSKDFTANCNFVQELVNTFRNKGKLVGIYASLYMWEQVMGSRSACAKFTDVPLWYAHYDNVASFSDWSSVSFGGWSKPAIKQYKGDTTLCGAGVDLNFY